MPLARLVAVVLVVFTSYAFGQQQPSSAGRLPGNLQWHDDFWVWTSTATPSEPWRILPNSGQIKESTVEKPFKFSFVFPDQIAIKTPDTLCYSIHSFVVARDRKDSDAVHPVRSSTCQPSSRYSVRNAEVRTAPVQP